MKKGFLKTDKAKRATEAAVDAEERKEQDEQSRKRRYDDGEKVDVPPVVPPAAEKAPPEELEPVNLHEIPKYMGAQRDKKKRVVFRVWPRDPNGKIIGENDVHGKETSNGINLWGATLYDFFNVRRMPNNPYLRTISTGSRLAAHMRKFGELEYAAPEIAWAEKEDEPRQIYPCDVSLLIDDSERHEKMGLFRDSSTWSKKDKECGGKQVNELGVELNLLSTPQPDEEDPADENEDQDEAEDQDDAASDIGSFEHDVEMRKPDDCNDEGGAVGEGAEKAAECGQHSVEASKVTASGDVEMGDVAGEKSGEGAPDIQRDVEMQGEQHDLDDEGGLDPNEAKDPNGGTEVHGDTRGVQNDGEQTHNNSEETGGVGKNTAGDCMDVEDKAKDEDKPSIFDYNPYPWARNNPFVGLHPVLQKHLPYHLLPQKLVVHDPWELLRVTRRHHDKEPFTNQPDIVREYRLQLTEEGEEKARRSLLDRALQDQCVVKEEDEWYTFPPQVKAAGPVDQYLITAKIPPRPKLPKHIPEAHLYLSPAHLLGTGNHSYVYKAIWELPRWALVPDVLCNACYMEAVDREVEKKRQAGELLTPEELKEQARVDFVEKVVPVPGRQVYHTSAPRTYSLDGTDSAEDASCYTADMVADETQLVMEVKYSGPIIEVYPDVKWQNPERGPLCVHLKSGLGDKEEYGTPLTARVQVAAKLSIQHDRHLALETANYQKFPDHFFEHWNGYNVMPPLHDPVPVGAVCPQFYGYYVPVEETEDPKGKAKGKGASSYLSPILLVEHCGKPVQPDKLSIDDRQECASLLLRFHHEGYLHNSFREDNIVVQDGPLTEAPVARKFADPKINSFRLIDFSRASEISSVTRAQEEETCLRLFQLHHHSDGSWD